MRFLSLSWTFFWKLYIGNTKKIIYGHFILYYSPKSYTKTNNNCVLNYTCEIKINYLFFSKKIWLRNLNTTSLNIKQIFWWLKTLSQYSGRKFISKGIRIVCEKVFEVQKEKKNSFIFFLPKLQLKVSNLIQNNIKFYKNYKFYTLMRDITFIFHGQFFLNLFS